MTNTNTDWMYYPTCYWDLRYDISVPLYQYFI